MSAGEREYELSESLASPSFCLSSATGCMLLFSRFSLDISESVGAGPQQHGPAPSGLAAGIPFALIALLSTVTFSETKAACSGSQSGDAGERKLR